MKYKYISIPSIWIPKNNLKSYIITSGEQALDSNDSRIVFLSYIVLNDHFICTPHLATDPEKEYLCNSEAEFLEKVQEAKLMNIISQ